jgi:hypothetical protein
MVTLMSTQSKSATAVPSGACGLGLQDDDRVDERSVPAGKQEADRLAINAEFDAFVSGLTNDGGTVSARQSTARAATAGACRARGHL